MLDKLVKEHIILGIDPGTLYMGYAILRTSGSQVEIIDFGVFDVHKLEDQYARLQKQGRGRRYLFRGCKRLRSRLRSA
jgi:hypothetical protein